MDLDPAIVCVAGSRQQIWNICLLAADSRFEILACLKPSAEARVVGLYPIAVLGVTLVDAGELWDNELERKRRR